MNPHALYVIGHTNPDTDAIASAVGYAWLLQNIREEDVIPARAGQLNRQTTWVLQRLEMEPPLLLPDASPRFASITHRLNTTLPDRPLREAWVIANRTGGIAPLVDPDGAPYGLVTVLSLFKFLSQQVGSHPRREDIRIGDLLARPCRDACDTDVPRFLISSRIRDALPLILREERSVFWVVDEQGAYAGVCRQRDALNPPRLQLVLVDHNEAGQALGALDEADIVEILDHHRLGNPPTRAPIRFTVDVVGSTSTLVSERIEEEGLSAPPHIAGLLLAGLISDTLILTSPTTTERDQRAADRLARWAFIGGSPLAGETVDSFGEALLQAGANFAARDPEDIVTADLKLYEAGGMHFGIAQTEVTSFAQLEEYRQPLLAALQDLQKQKNLDFAILMITNVVSRSSRLLFSNDVPILRILPYPRREDGLLDARDVVSRKKQLLPAVLSALES